MRQAPPFFEGFEQLDFQAGGVRFRGVVGGQGPPILLLHGFPQTHVAWRLVAPQLAKSFTLIVPDLPGYGDSRTQSATPRWTKRRVADALAVLMGGLGHRRFGIVGHDRGARAGYRLALDHPDRVTAFASLTVVPTLEALEAIDKDKAFAAFHWFMFAQPFDLPERLLACDPDAFFDTAMTKMSVDIDRFDRNAMQAYRMAFRDPAVRHAMCEDYRAAMNEDLAHDTADRAGGRQLACPVLVLWPDAKMSALEPTPRQVWQRWAGDVDGKAIAGGHLQPEESADQVLTELLPFLARSRARA
ncbi:alpha/beta fold hydrolase [uncultured Enterovirga sp.]|uniref:alpha/beta fold hydrolase n=1 Tax=uncultured Enterovirga sp. TaxID=2026352 RepID=UPI0035CA23A8